MAKRYEEKLTSVEVGFTCDKCSSYYSTDDWVEWQEKLSFVFTGGYGSVFGDGAIVKLDLCQKCVLEVLGPYCQETE